MLGRGQLRAGEGKCCFTGRVLACDVLKDRDMLKTRQHSASREKFPEGANSKRVCAKECHRAAQCVWQTLRNGENPCGKSGVDFK